MYNSLILVLFLFFIHFASAQSINQFDAEGKRHGVWTKSFPNTNLPRYEGTFSHGKEVGLFKFYKNIKNKAVLSVTKQFSKADDIAEVRFLNAKGKVIGEGKMNGKAYLGTWKFYDETANNLLIIEHYNNIGQLHGKRIVYYDNGQVAEEQYYVNGKLEGESKLYSENAILLKQFVYFNDELHGISKYYNPKGELITEGYYKNGKKYGVWKFYENGKLKEEKDFSYKPKKTAP